MPGLLSVSPLLPAYRYAQVEITEPLVESLSSDEKTAAVIRRIHGATGVEHRSLVMPIDAYREIGDFTHANQLFREHGLPLAVAATRQRDVLVGFGFFVFANVLLLGIVALANDVVASGGSSGVQVAFAIVVVGVNFMLWLWNDSGIKDVQASTKGIMVEDRDLAISQNFINSPWVMYRVLVAIITAAVAAGLLFAVFS